MQMSSQKTIESCLAAEKVDAQAIPSLIAILTALLTLAPAALALIQQFLAIVLPPVPTPTPVPPPKP